MNANYRISLMLVVLFSLASMNCRKTDVQNEVQNKSTNQTIDTAGIVFEMGGMRYWTGKSSTMSPMGSSDYTINDTFEIMPFTGGSVGVLVKGEFLDISNLDTNLKTVSFSYTPPSGGMVHYHYYVKYYYEIDRIEYLEAQNTGASTWTSRDLHTYTP